MIWQEPYIPKSPVCYNNDGLPIIVVVKVRIVKVFIWIIQIWVVSIVHFVLQILLVLDNVEPVLKSVDLVLNPIITV